jgi:hypothetical protein
MVSSVLRVRRTLADLTEVKDRSNTPQTALSTPGGAILTPGSPQQIHCKEQAMCYEERYFSEWAKKAARKREETRSATERRTPDAQPDRPKQEPTRPEEVEHELEAV